MLDIYDRVGAVVMDENRQFGNETDYFLNMGAMVKRDRNHPAITVWSFCNEGNLRGGHCSKDLFHNRNQLEKGPLNKGRPHCLIHSCVYGHVWCQFRMSVAAGVSLECSVLDVGH